MSRGTDLAYPLNFDDESRGMTIREAFAMAAMQGYIAAGEVVSRAIAHDSVIQADALLVELEKERL